MGDLYGDDDFYIQSNVEGLNLRFAPGPPLAEMVRLQKQFKIFSPQHALQDSIAVLNVTSASWALRSKWYALLSWIAGLDSNQAGRSGGEAISSTVQQNLEADEVRPVHFETHDYNRENRVLIKSRDGRPIFYIDESYLVISLPLRAKPP